MTRIVAIQMDPIETIDIEADSTFALALEAQRRGFVLHHYLPGDLSWRQGRIIAHAHPLKVRREKGAHYEKRPGETLDLANVDVVLMRQDPPFDLAYITATHILEQLAPSTLVVNDPVAVRNAPEKLYATHFAEWMPPTLISRRKEEIRAFREEYGDIIVKPLYGNGGAGVFHLRPEDENLNALLDLFFDIYREPLMVQRYVPEVKKGDKRIIFVEGEPVGAINRVPPPGEARSNLHVGGRAEPAELTGRDREICAALGPSLREAGLLFVGIDVIGHYLTEINVTSPTGIQEISRFDETDIAARVWDAIEARLEAKRPASRPPSQTN
ncbi:MAG: glutathione synthase [Alphaproteobacteria bacterium]|nr:MAG: glutathione synthase [Alphaproteobacteria bacterium]